MRTILVAILGAATIALGASGCASSTKPIGVDKTAPAALQTAQAAINEARIAIGASAAERDVFVARLESMRDDVKEAERLKDLGNLTGAEKKASAARAIIVLLQKELAAKAKETK